jgi:hypothetical protein
VTRHASIEDLARLADGDLRPRKAARISIHLAGCGLCTENSRQVQAVPGILASAQFPPMPETLFGRIEMAISAESSVRVAAQPASESARRTLPASGGPARRGWRPPPLSSRLALRVAAVAGAAVVVAGGGYEIATQAGGGQSTPSASSAGSVHGPHAGGAGQPGVTPVKFGPAVEYGHNPHMRSITTVETNTNFHSASFRQETAAALTSVDRSHYNRANQSLAVTPAAGSKAAPTPAMLPTFGVPDLSKLRGCVTLVAAGRNVLLVDLAKFQGKAATVIIVGRDSSGPAEAFAVGPGCSSTVDDILAHEELPRL